MTDEPKKLFYIYLCMRKEHNNEKNRKKWGWF